VRRPDLARTFKVPLYPLPPLLFAGATGYMLWFLVGQRPQELMWGGVTLLVGGVLYAGLRGRQEMV
jgi:APA family basic amino acid/polyamine antiporter